MPIRYVVSLQEQVSIYRLRLILDPVQTYRAPSYSKVRVMKQVSHQRSAYDDNRWYGAGRLAIRRDI